MKWAFLQWLPTVLLICSVTPPNAHATSNWDTMLWDTDVWFDVASDPDEDGLTDDEEINVYGTNPAIADSDGDGLTDGAEVHIHMTNPNVGDSDNDGISDGDEILIGSDPNVFDVAKQIPWLLLPFSIVLSLFYLVAGARNTREHQKKQSSCIGIFSKRIAKQTP